MNREESLEKLEKPYDSKATESRIYEAWEQSGYFNPDNLPERHEEPWSIVMPPPNANGSLHAGHALFITLEDIMTRYARMRGKRALWIPGADHAGFETQVVYEKKLEKEGRSRFGMDPKALYDEICAFTIENKRNMESQVRSMGASCDWSREKFTLDPDVVEEVQKTFIRMHEEGLVYRGKRTINWCPKHETSLSDVETENPEEKARLYYFAYGPFEIATARPETKFGDKYVVMHPRDARYAKWKHSDKLTVEWINGPLEATVIKDPVIDMEFGTGVMTITPWHSAIDFDIAERHGLDMEQIIDWRGRLLPIAGEFAGMKIGEAREKIVEKLEKKGLLARIDENYIHTTKRCYKCNSLIEPQVKDQWFVKMKPLAEMALGAIDRKEIRFIPENYEKIFRYWMENTIDWNISRQIVWGIPIPAWFHAPICVPIPGREDDVKNCESVKVSLEEPSCEHCRAKYIHDPDTFDTWFSSGQWPQIVTGYPDGRDFETYYPTDVMETGHDLIFKWVPRMVIFGLYLNKQAPFHTVYLHGLVHDARGKKMSKSKGNVVNPLDLTARYGTDALRMGLVIGNTPGSDLALREDKVKAYKHFANKIWNASRFVLQNLDGFDPAGKPELSPEDTERLRELAALLADITKDLDQYRFYLAGEKLYHYFWHTFADKIIEQAKSRLSGDDAADKLSAQYALFTTLASCLKALHPFMPFITEEIWSMMPIHNKKMLMIESWPCKT